MNQILKNTKTNEMSSLSSTDWRLDVQHLKSLVSFSMYPYNTVALSLICLDSWISRYGTIFPFKKNEKKNQARMYEERKKTHFATMVA